MHVVADGDGQHSTEPLCAGLRTHVLVYEVECAPERVAHRSQERDADVGRADEDAVTEVDALTRVPVGVDRQHRRLGGRVAGRIGGEVLRE